jgi:hypothetical protein
LGFEDSRVGVGRIEEKRWIGGLNGILIYFTITAVLTVRLIECNDGSALDSWLPTA